MSETAFQTQYRDEAIAGFEQHQSHLRETTTTEAVIKGDRAVFLVVDSGGAETVTRGTNGRIPARGDNNAQHTCILSEEHDKVEKTRFNIFASQGNQRAIMQRTSMAVINRKIDNQILTELSTATQTAGTPATGGLNLATKALAILGNNEVEYDGQVCAVISPAFLAYLLRDSAFTSADFVQTKPLDGASAQPKYGFGYYDWMNVHWIVHPRVPGKGTNDETCFMYHKAAIGHAADSATMDTAVGYNEEDDYSYCRHTLFMGAKVLQPNGIIKMRHDASAIIV